MISWLLTLPAGWLVVVVLLAVYLGAAIIFLLVVGLASERRAQMLSALSPGMLSPLGVVFGLIVAFLASGIWSNAGTAQTAVNTEASALRASVLLVEVFPRRPADEMRRLIAQQIDQEVRREWPDMAHGRATIAARPVALTRALHLALMLTPHTAGETDAQRELVTQLEDALDARRQRIIVSRSQVNGVKWAGVLVLGFLLLAGMACVHCTRRMTAAVSLALFATAVAFSLILLISQDRPFNGPFAIKPTALQQVRPLA